MRRNCWAARLDRGVSQIDRTHPKVPDRAAGLWLRRVCVVRGEKVGGRRRITSRAQANLKSPESDDATCSVGVVGQRVHVCDVESRALDLDELVVDLGPVDGPEYMHLSTVRRVNLVIVLHPANAGEAAVVVLIVVLIRKRNNRCGARRYVWHDLR